MVPVSGRAVLLLVAATMACLLPFSDKPYHIDDPLFVWVARQIVKSPFDFYGFAVNWYEHEQPVSEIVKNPPLFSFWLALAGWIAGWHERVLHVASLFFSVGAVMGTYQLGRVLTGRPAVAALVTLLTPVFLISATQVMCDVPMLCLWLWSVYFWVDGERRHRVRRLWLAAVLAGFCVLTKYFGAALIPLLAAYSLARSGRPNRRLLLLLVPAVLLLIYQYVTWQHYGQGLFSDAASYAFTTRSADRAPMVLVRGLVFTGGCLASFVAFGAVTTRRRTAFLWLGGLVVALLVSLMLRVVGPVAWRDALGIGRAGVLIAPLFFFVGCTVIALVIADWRRNPTPEGLLLALWAVGTFVFASWVNWSLNGRSLLPLAPVCGLVVVRRVQGAGPLSAIRWGVAILAAAVIALAPTWADYRHASSAKSAALGILDRFSGAGRVWFQGHWGFQYYMEVGGAKALDRLRLNLRPGDLVVVPWNNTYTEWMENAWFGEAEYVQWDSARWLACTDYSTGAGFYSDFIGPLPFYVGAVGPERYAVFPVRAHVVTAPPQDREH